MLAPLQLGNTPLDSTPRAALIVAHGSPADPFPQEAALKSLAVRVAMRLPGWRIAGTTLAAEGALEQALARLDRPLVYPFFMAEGWFTRTTLPRRLTAAGATDLQQLPAFGTDPALPALMARVALDAARAARLDPAQTTLLLAAHGSPSLRRLGHAALAAVAQELPQAVRPLTGTTPARGGSLFQAVRPAAVRDRASRAPAVVTGSSRFPLHRGRAAGRDRASPPARC
jgi:sirohydrochlorin ferrochelatase